MSQSPPQPLDAAGITASPDDSANNAAAGSIVLTKVKSTGGVRLWMRFDRSGQSELVEWDEKAIIRHARIPGRDLRILNSVFSHSSKILAGEKTMVINLTFVKAIVTAEEVLVFSPLRQEVIPFVEGLRQQLSGPKPIDVEELPFEFEVLEMALQSICTYLDSNVAEVERVSSSVLDEWTKNIKKVSIENVEHVTRLKTNIKKLLETMQQIWNEIKHLVGDKENMSRLYLTRKLLNQQLEEAKLGATISSNLYNFARAVRGLGSNRSKSNVTSPHYGDDNDVNDLAMLLDIYLNYFEDVHIKLLSVRVHIDNTEKYVNGQLDKHRDERNRLQLIFSIAYFVVSIAYFVVGVVLPHFLK